MSELQTSLVQSNEIIKANDFQFAFDNVVENMNILTLLLLGSQKDFVIGGNVVPYDYNSLNINIEPILCGNSKGTFVYQSETIKNIAITPANQDRIDIVQIKGGWEEFDKQQRAFIDFETDIQTYQDVFTKKRFIPIVEIKEGIEGSAIAPTTDEGFIKIAEIKVYAGENYISDENIFNITSDIPDLENENWTNEKDKTYNIGYISDVNRRFRQQHEKNGTHKENIIGEKELNIGCKSQQINSNILPIGKDIKLVNIQKTATESILSSLEFLSSKIVELYNDYMYHGQYSFNGELKISELSNEDKSLLNFFTIGTKTEDNLRKFYIKFSGVEILTLSENGRITVGERNATNNNDLVTKFVTDSLLNLLDELSAKVDNIELNLDSTVYSNKVLSRYSINNITINVATTNNISLNSLQIIDYISLNPGDIVLVKNQDNKKENGIYEVTSSLWLRITNFSKPSDFKYHLFEIQNGKLNKGKFFYLPKELFSKDVFGEEDIEFSEYFGSKIPLQNKMAVRDESGNVKTNQAVQDLDCVNLNQHLQDLNERILVSDIKIYAGIIDDTHPVPVGWLLCDGREVSKATYSALYAAIGDKYGVASDTSKFKLPDYRECVLVGAGENKTLAIASHDVYELGEFKDDQFQDHVHIYARCYYGDANKMYHMNTTIGIAAALDNPTNGPGAIKEAVGRTGSTTHGKQVGVNYLIRY